VLGSDPATNIDCIVIYQFGNCTLDTARRELRQGDGLVAVEPQVFDVLEFLIEARDRVVSRDDLLDAGLARPHRFGGDAQ
jgi:DNA-binding winged helix-turn-helix (wHTH) protein